MERQDNNTDHSVGRREGGNKEWEEGRMGGGEEKKEKLTWNANFPVAQTVKNPLAM